MVDRVCRLSQLHAQTMCPQGFATRWRGLGQFVCAKDRSLVVGFRRNVQCQDAIWRDLMLICSIAMVTVVMVLHGKVLNSPYVKKLKNVNNCTFPQLYVRL